MKQQVLIQIFEFTDLIPRNCAIPELVNTYWHSDSWQNEHVFSCFTVLVTVSKGST